MALALRVADDRLSYHGRFGRLAMFDPDSGHDVDGGRRLLGYARMRRMRRRAAMSRAGRKCDKSRQYRHRAI